METSKQDLSSRQKELVAVGASIGAGCHPCVAHHLKAGAAAGLGGEQLLAAVDGAERVASEATVLVADHAREQLGPTITTPATLTPLEDALAGFGAALGANDAAAIDIQLRAALDFGASKQQLGQAIETAKNVHENAGRIHVRKAEQLLESIEASPTAETDATSDGGCGAGDQSKAPPVGASAAAAKDEAAAGEGCGCGSDSETEPEQPADETSDAKDKTEAGFGFKPPMAKLFATAGERESFDPAAMMAHCRQMFGGLFGQADAPAETKEPPTPPAAKGCSSAKEV